MAFVLLSAGCSDGGGCPTVHAETDADVQVCYNDTEYLCHIRYISNDTAALTLLTPSDISGLTFTRSNGECALGLGSLMCRGGGLSGATLADEVFRVYDAITTSEPEFLGRDADGVCEFLCDGLTIRTDSGGGLISSSSDKIKLQIK